MYKQTIIERESESPTVTILVEIKGVGPFEVKTAFKAEELTPLLELVDSPEYELFRNMVHEEATEGSGFMRAHEQESFVLPYGLMLARREQSLAELFTFQLTLQILAKTSPDFWERSIAILGIPRETIQETLDTLASRSTEVLTSFSDATDLIKEGDRRHLFLNALMQKVAKMQ